MFLLVLMASGGVRRMSIIIITLIIYIREVTGDQRQGQHFLPLNPVRSSLCCVDGSIKKKTWNLKNNFRLEVVKIVKEFKLLSTLILAFYITIISIFSFWVWFSFEYILPPSFFFKTALLRYNSHTRQFIYLKCTIY